MQEIYGQLRGPSPLSPRLRVCPADWPLQCGKVKQHHLVLVQIYMFTGEGQYPSPALSPNDTLRVGEMSFLWHRAIRELCESRWLRTDTLEMKMHSEFNFDTVFLVLSLDETENVPVLGYGLLCYLSLWGLPFVIKMLNFRIALYVIFPPARFMH